MYRLLLGPLALGLLAAGWLIASYFRTPAQEAVVAVEEPQRAMGRLVAGHEYFLEFRVCNPTTKAARILCDRGF